ncbi:MAG: glycosyltransferase, partial [Actinomycetota bacterium]|nr:glycosyltransferase [Actinomycetota bacterium]
MPSATPIALAWHPLTDRPLVERPPRQPAGSDRGRYRVLHVLPHLGRGGGQYHMLRHISSMEVGHFEHVVCYLAARHDLRTTFEDAGLSPIFLDHRPGWGMGRTVVRLALLIRRERIDLVHANTRGDRLAAELAALLTSTPVVTTMRSPMSARFYRGYPSLRRQRTRRRQALERWLHRHTVRSVIAISESIRSQWLDTCRSLGFSHDVSLVYPGIDSAAFESEVGEGTAHEALGTQLGLAPGQPVLLNVAHLELRKGQRWLLAMMPEVLRHVPDAVLLIAGEGPERTTLETEITRRGLGASVRLLGKRDDVPQLLGRADVFVFSSYELPGVAEAFGVAVLEALAAGKPVVAFDL